MIVAFFSEKLQRECNLSSQRPAGMKKASMLHTAVKRCNQFPGWLKGSAPRHIHRLHQHQSNQFEVPSSEVGLVMRTIWLGVHAHDLLQDELVNIASAVVQ